MSDNEIYLLIKYIKSVLWRVANRLSYTEDARCLKVFVQRLRLDGYFALIWLGEVVTHAHGYCAVIAHASRSSVHISVDQVYVLLRSVVNRTADWLQVASVSCRIYVASCTALNAAHYLAYWIRICLLETVLTDLLIIRLGPPQISRLSWGWVVC